MVSEYETDFAWKDDSVTNDTDTRQVVSRLPYTGKVLDTGRHLASNRAVILISECPNAAFLLKVIAEYLASEHFNKSTIGTQNRKLKAAHEFITWLNHLHTGGHPIPPNVLGDFQSFIVNTYQVQPHSSGATEIHAILNYALENEDLKHKYNWLRALIKRSKFISHSEVEGKKSATILTWFQNSHISRPGNMNGLEAIISPKRLIDSFRMVISEVLLTLMAARESIYKHPKRQRIEKLLASYKKAWSQQKKQLWADDLYLCIKQKNIEEELDLLCQLDLLKGSFRRGEKDINGVNIYATRYMWFGPNLLLKATEFEQVLAAWLISSLSVQPEDVWKLSVKNIRMLEDTYNSEIGLQIAYRKGRGKKVSKPYTTDIVSSQAPHGKALIRFYELQKRNQDELFDGLVRSKSVTNPYAPVKRVEPSFSTLLIELVNSTAFKKRISHSSKKYKVSLLFHNALINLFNSNAITHSSWKGIKTKQGFKGDEVSLKTYYENYEFALPDFWFWNEHIKNTANHAESDQYRENDILINRSHSSAVEGSSYMTEQNKDWINQTGRATRLVLYDIESSVFKPNLSKVRDEITNRKTRLKIMKSLNASDGNVKSVHSNKDIDEANEPDAIVVIDNTETAVHFLHYIEQVKVHYKKLRENNANFLYFECLPTSEWMSHALDIMSNEVVLEAKTAYNKIKETLPNLFESELAQRGIS